jgi:hypothetical protein
MSRVSPTLCPDPHHVELVWQLVGRTVGPAERMRAYRRRRRHGLRCVKVRVGRADLDGLVEKGHLSPDKRKDLHAIGRLKTLCSIASPARYVTRNGFPQLRLTEQKVMPAHKGSASRAVRLSGCLRSRL